MKQFREHTKRSDTTVVVPGVKDDEVKKLAHLERTPDAQTIIEISLPGSISSALFSVDMSEDWKLPNRHPLEVSSDSVDLAGINGDLRTLEEGILGVVQGAEAISVAVVGKLCIIVNNTLRLGA